MVKRIKRGSALALAALLLAMTAAPKEAYGALGIETDPAKQPCSITFDLGGLTGEDSEFAELKGLEIPVKLYKVADVKVDGSYELDPAYSGLSDKLKEALDSANVQDTEKKAEDWQNLAAGIRALIPEGKAGDHQVTLTAGTGKAEDLSVGLYLVCAGTVWSDEYVYTFSPYLISVPDNAYYRTEPGDDTWIYDVSVSLKPQRGNRFGDLEIRKTLDSYNASLGSVSFIFQVDAEKDGIIYSDVVSLVFDGPGTRSAVVRQKIPAGAAVTVREVYGGASCSVSGSEVQTVENALAATILPETEEADPGEAPRNQVSFLNTYDNRLNGGTSVVNHFTYDENADGGPWVWSRQNDSSVRAEGE